MILRNIRPWIRLINGVRPYRTNCEKIECTFSIINLNISQLSAKPAPKTNDFIEFSNKSMVYKANASILPIKQSILDLPLAPIHIVPFDKKIIIGDILPLIKDVECPTSGNVIEKKAHRMIIQRRRKMKKHQLKKWRKKFKFEIRKKKQRREIKKEKEFLGRLANQIRLAEEFNPEEFVVAKLKKAADVPVLEKYRRPPVRSNIIYHPGIPGVAKPKI